MFEEPSLVTPYTHAQQGIKAIRLFIVCHSHQHENSQIVISRHHSDSQAQRICQNLWKTCCIMLQIVLERPTSIVNSVFYWPNLSTTPTAGLLMRTTCSCRLRSSTASCMLLQLPSLCKYCSREQKQCVGYVFYRALVFNWLCLYWGFNLKDAPLLTWLALGKSTPQVTLESIKWCTGTCLE